MTYCRDRQSIWPESHFEQAVFSW